MEEEKFTKAEIWEAVLQLGGSTEDLTKEEVEESQKQLFDLLDATTKNRKASAAGTDGSKAE